MPSYLAIKGGNLMNKGFTLIELLVVVLIIGILASIALPQYTKAVERSRMAEAVQILGDLGTAQSVFYMMYSEFASGLSDLNSRGDITIPGPAEGGSWTLEVGEADGVQTMTRSGGMYNGGQLVLTVRTDGTITKRCIPPEDEQFCGMAETAGYTQSAPTLNLRPHPAACLPGTPCGERRQLDDKIAIRR